MELRILRENDGDVISVKMGMAGVDRITHTEKAGDIYITLWGADKLSIVGQVIISNGVPYDMIDLKNNLMKDGSSFNSEGTDAKTYKDMARMGKALQQGFKPNTAFANRSHTGFANRNRVYVGFLFLYFLFILAQARANPLFFSLQRERA